MRISDAHLHWGRPGRIGLHPLARSQDLEGEEKKETPALAFKATREGAR